MRRRYLLVAGCALVAAIASAVGLVWIIAARGSAWSTLPEALGLALISGTCVGIAAGVAVHRSSTSGDSAHVGVLIGLFAVVAFELATMAVWLISQVNLT